MSRVRCSPLLRDVEGFASSGVAVSEPVCRSCPPTTLPDDPNDAKTAELLSPLSLAAGVTVVAVEEEEEEGEESGDLRGNGLADKDDTYEEGG